MKKILYILGLFCVNTAVSIELELPTDCDMANNCYVRTYPDHSSNIGEIPTDSPAVDYTCGNLARKNYRATDIQATYYNHKKPPAVIAAESGQIIAVRRNLPDSVNSEYIPYQTPVGMEAGNSVIIKHENGWETQYNHLKFGSILVKEGQYVKKGDKIAEMGASGATVLPKIGFAVRQNDKPVDPFLHNETTWTCKGEGRILWSVSSLQELDYRSVGIGRKGFSESVPEAHRIRAGLSIPEIRRKSPDSIVFWADIFGVKEDDVIYLRIIDPTGNVLAEQETIAPTDYPVWLAYTGRHIKASAITTGIYLGEIIVQRDNAKVISQFQEVELVGDREPPTRAQIRY